MLNVRKFFQQLPNFDCRDSFEDQHAQILKHIYANDALFNLSKRLSTPQHTAFALLVFANSDERADLLAKHTALYARDVAILTDVTCLIQKFSILKMGAFFSTPEIQVLFIYFMLNGGFAQLRDSFVFHRHPQAYLEAVEILFHRHFESEEKI